MTFGLYFSNIKKIIHPFPCVLFNFSFILPSIVLELILILYYSIFGGWMTSNLYFPTFKKFIHPFPCIYSNFSFILPSIVFDLILILYYSIFIFFNYLIIILYYSIFEDG